MEDRIVDAEDRVAGVRPAPGVVLGVAAGEELGQQRAPVHRGRLPGDRGGSLGAGAVLARSAGLLRQGGDQDRVLGETGLVLGRGGRRREGLIADLAEAVRRRSRRGRGRGGRGAWRRSGGGGRRRTAAAGGGGGGRGARGGRGRRGRAPRG